MSTLSKVLVIFCVKQISAKYVSLAPCTRVRVPTEVVFKTSFFELIFFIIEPDLTRRQKPDQGENLGRMAQWS